MSAKIKLVNWKIHKKLTLDLGESVDLLQARNGMGKSAIIDAIEFCLNGTGKLQGVQHKKDLGAQMVHDDASACSVMIQFDGDFGVERRMKRDGTQAVTLYRADRGLEGPITVQQSLINRELNLDEAKLLAVLDARSIFTGTANQRKAVLFGATGQNATEAQVLKAFAALDLEGEDVNAAAAAVIEHGWRASEANAGTKRAEVKAILNGRQRPVAVRFFSPKGLDKEFDLEKWTPEDLEAKRKVNQDSVDDIRTSEAIDYGARREVLRQKIEQSEVAQGAKDALIEAGRGVDSIEDLISCREPLESIAIEARELLEMARNDERIARNERDGIPTLEASAKAQVVEKPEVCTLIAGRPECPFAAAALKRLQGTLDAQLESASELLEQHTEQVSAAESVIKEAVKVVDMRSEECLQADEELRGVKGAYDEEVERQRQMAEACVTIERLTSEVATAEADVAGAEQGESEQSQVKFHQQRLDVTLEMIDARRRYDAAISTAAAYDDETAKLEKRRDRHDAIAQALKPNGIEQTLLAQILAPFELKLNEIGQRTGELRITEDLEVEMKFLGIWRRWAQLSESGKERMAHAVQHAIAAVAGFPILLIDRMDHLDRDGKTALMNSLVAVSPQYRSVLALATCQTSSPTAAKSAGVTSWVTEGGADAVRIS